MTESKMDFEKISLTNLVHFYREELLAIENGEPITEVLSTLEQRRMTKLGILSVNYEWRRHTTLSDETRRLLNDGTRP